MKYAAALFFSMLLALSSPAHAEKRDWTFVESVGGLSVGTPYHTAEGVMLPVRAAVSGIKTFTVKPTVMNSSVGCEKVIAVVEGHKIYLTVETSFGGNSRCPAAKLGAVEAGKYAVLYREPDGHTVPLDKVTIP
jgi:hypothetical protein